MEKISKHITFAEATKSQTAIRHGIDNYPSEFQLKNMKMVAEKCFEPLREHHGKPIGISSFLRSSALNSKIGGSKTSQHLCGAFSGIEEGAIDIDADIFNNGITNAEVFHFLKNNVEFDQLIWEFGDENNPSWVHVSFRKGANRKMLLMAYKTNSGTKYEII
jgi:hypothetical protein